MFVYIILVAKLVLLLMICREGGGVGKLLFVWSSRKESFDFERSRPVGISIRLGCDSREGTI